MEDIIKAPLVDDSFIHFTYDDRAQEIIDSGKLLANPPYAKFGIAGVQAISVKFGVFVPGVQLTHLMKTRREDQKIVAVMFKTRTMPKVGYPEEVIWPEGVDVELNNPKIISVVQARRILAPRSDQDYRIIYESFLASIV